MLVRYEDKRWMDDGVPEEEEKKTMFCKNEYTQDISRQTHEVESRMEERRLPYSPPWKNYKKGSVPNKHSFDFTQPDLVVVVEPWLVVYPPQPTSVRSLAGKLGSAPQGSTPPLFLQIDKITNK